MWTKCGCKPRPAYTPRTAQPVTVKPGTGKGPNLCVTLNPNGGKLNLLTLPNEYAFGVQVPADLTVTGFQLFTQAKTQTTQMSCGLYRSTASGLPTAQAAAVGTMTVGTGVAFWTVFLNQEVTIKKGETFWISQTDTTTVNAADLISGTPAPVGMSALSRKK